MLDFLFFLIMATEKYFSKKDIQALTSNLHWPYRHARAALGKVDHSWVELVFK